MKKHHNLPLVLLILDGWGVAPEAPGNAINQAKTPNIDRYIATYPAMTLAASGEHVGLPDKESGSSEIGHLTIGLGRPVLADLTKINKSISSGEFFKNAAFWQAIEHSQKNKSNLHLVGLLSSGAVHSHIDHLFALLDLVKENRLSNVYLHLILDGIDTSQTSGLNFLDQLLAKIANDKIKVKIASISGRYYAMDRVGNWQRTEKAFRAMVFGEAENYCRDPRQAISDSYAAEIFDSKIKPTVIIKTKHPVALIEDEDAVIFFNFRADRANQLAATLSMPDFAKFDRPTRLKNLFFCSMTQYDRTLPVDAIAFPDAEYDRPLAEILSLNGIRQLHITETEKYPHLTYYFNGKRQSSFENEDWVLVPSLKVGSYEGKPEMSAAKITDQILKFVTENRYDFIVANYPNADLLSHTANLKSTVKACQIIDKQLSKIVPLVLSKHGMVIITSDHGTAEELQDIQTGEINTAHSSNPVPFILISQEFEGKNIGLPDTFGADLSMLKPRGSLADIAPTILDLLNIDKPDEMTGRSLI